ncbi:GMC oxidoreductase [Cylindrobasidium torrendii FP15055 ss-10]|uniref:GMC oxidoreductase n=1 Tax=Cylindrobasidium torrendii FP15055 ss-10 TaxID=1314674 RepID=A0A0D7BND0_9AGAR|nr:GMC oxidoreductase [Cylindrobasidium torrendii FP15055 ss-10]
MPVVEIEQILNTSIDYIIAGGGTSGLVLAVRLAQADSSAKIAVIEAGDYHRDDPVIDVPGYKGKSLASSKYNWGFQSEPQLYANGRNIPYARGKGLGGSTLINNFAWVRPSKEELDAWSELGNAGWDWETMLEYMKKSEHIQHPRISSPEEAERYAAVPRYDFHGSNGPIAMSYTFKVTRVHTEMLDALEKLGIPRNPDNMCGRPVGGILLPGSIDQDNAKRSTSASGYYTPNEDLPNLLVLTSAHVLKVELVATADGLYEAKGVQLEVKGKIFTVNARREVVLSAGAFQSPQLLELSGIGQEGLIKSLGIQSLVDLPGVGENLQDHGHVPVVVEVDGDIETMEVLLDPEVMKEHEELYKHHDGLLAGNSSATFAYLPAKSIADSATVEDWVSRATVDHIRGNEELDASVKEGLRRHLDIKKRWLEDENQAVAQILTVNGVKVGTPGVDVQPGKRYQTILVAYTQPLHAGSVHIGSSDARAAPAIQPKFLANPVEEDILVKGLTFIVQKLLSTNPLKDTIKAKPLPPFEGDADEETVRNYVRSKVSTAQHPCGTAAMAPRECGGVVDRDLRVYGTRNLRVVDCSVMPMVVGNNIQTIAYAIGEKVSGPRGRKGILIIC